MKKYLLLVLLLIQQTALASEEGLYAWWMTIEFPVTETKILTQSISKLNKNWVKATLLSDALLKQHTSQKQYQEFKNSKMQFQWALDMNNNGIKEQFYTGVYKDKNNQTGKFVAIFESNKLIKIFTRSGKPGYNALLRTKEQISWYQCMQCGEFEAIKWNGKTYGLE